jgi:hypothetical protein
VLSIFSTPYLDGKCILSFDNTCAIMKKESGSTNATANPRNNLVFVLLLII